MADSSENRKHVKLLTDLREASDSNAKDSKECPDAPGVSSPCGGQTHLQSCKKGKYVGYCKYSIVCDDVVIPDTCKVAVVCDIRITAPCQGGKSMTDVTPCSGASLPHPCKQKLKPDSGCKKVVQCGNWEAMEKPDL